MKIPEAAIEAAARNAESQIRDDHDSMDSMARRIALRRNVADVLQAALPALRRQMGDHILQALDMQAELDEDTAERVGGIVLDALTDDQP